MGEVLKFKRPKRRSRPSVLAHPGTLIFFTGVWHQRQSDPVAAPKRRRAGSTKQPAKPRSRSVRSPRDNIQG